MYRHLSLLRLAELIAQDGDRDALRELHDNRTLFYYQIASPLRLAEFADKLRQSKQGWQWSGQDAGVLENAYDLTISKFSNLPAGKISGRSLKTQGPDCRYYFGAFVKYASEKMYLEHCVNEAQREMQLAKILQSHVIRHFRLSCLECARSGRQLTKRYLWKFNGHAMNIMLPVQIPARQCSRWLSENVPNVDPSRPGERERVQAVVDGLIAGGKILSIEDVDEGKILMNRVTIESEVEEQISVKGLADAVACEKAENISSQRPAIQKLGSQKLQKLVLKIFETLADGEYEALSIAKSFGISPATLSRFAGMSWSNDTGNELPVPDLWLNTAQVLAEHSVFTEIAENAGVLSRVKEILSGSSQRNEV